MNFLFPLYMLGAAALAVPIYLHLRRKPPKDSIDFSSLMFLEPTKHQPLKRRSQLENWPLLLLRCLALLALVAVFSRPFFAGGEGGDENGLKRTVVVIDTSASMRRDGLWPMALSAAADAVSETSPDGALAVVSAASSAGTVFAFADWQDAEPSRRAELARAAIKSLQPGWGGTDLGSAMLAAAEMVADAASGEDAALPAEIVLISDLQAGAALDSVAEAAWPGDLVVKLVPIEAVDTTNASVGSAASADRSKIAVRVRNDPTSERSEFTVAAGAQTLAAIVPPGESRVFEFDTGPDKVVLTGDDHDFDNTVFVAPREPVPIAALFLGRGDPDDGDAPEYYFRRAFSPSPILKPSFVENLAAAPSIIAVARPLDAAETGDLRRAIEGGARALLALTGTEMARTLGALAGMPQAPSLKEFDDGYALLEKIDFDHPALAGFRDPRWRDFTAVHFWRHRAIEPSALPEGTKIVASFDSGAPAWFEVPVGRGSLFVMTSGWQPKDSQLSLSSKFLPLLFSIFADAGSRVGESVRFFVGEALPLEDGETLADSAPPTPAEPGIYRTEGDGPPRHFAVNLRPSESELAPLSQDALAALGIPIAGLANPTPATSAADKPRLRNTESEAKQNLWRWVVLVLLGLLAVESWLAARPAPSPVPQPAHP